jgi:hypothetical protein
VSYYGVMANRRELLFLSALPAIRALAAGAAAKIPKVTIDPGRARLEWQPFRDLRTYLEGPTDQLHSMTARSLRLQLARELHGVKNTGAQPLAVLLPQMAALKCAHC